MNVYYICVIARVQMWCVYSQLLDDQTKKDFSVFHVFLEEIFVTLVLKMFPKMSIFHCCKTLSLAISLLVPQVATSHEIFKKFQFLKILDREFLESLVTQTWIVRFCPLQLHILRLGLWLARKMQKRQFLKGLKCQFSKSMCFCTPRLPHTKTHIFLKTHPNFLGFHL